MNIRQRCGLGLMIIASSWPIDVFHYEWLHAGGEFDVFGVPVIVLCIFGELYS